MTTTTTTTSGKEPASSPSSPSSVSRSCGSYHVFLSFRGEDTRYTFADHLHTALTDAGFRTFRDDDEIQRGESIKVELRRAIEESRVSIVVLSRNYASSSWCLDELAMILGRRRRGDSGHVVLPVFYGVDPSEVRKQKGVYAEAFARHEERFKFEVGEGEAAKEWKEKLKAWKEALEEVAGLAGMPLPDGGDRHESKFIQKIVKVVEDKIRRPRVLNVAPYPIGLDSRAKSINLWLQDEGVDVEIIAICGMGGIGKTTIAKFLYNSNCTKFEGSSFLTNIREIFGQQNGLIRLQSQLLSDILSRREAEIRNVDEGILKIKDVIGFKRVLIVLDDVDKREQLDAILGMKDWLSPGSKLIITTRHEQLLRAHECWKVHRVKELDHHESLQLFSWYAFGQSHPIDGYLVDSKRAVDYCRGLPLAVKILGSSLSGRSLDVWKSQLQKLKAIPENEILQKLKLSYDSLQDDHDKDLFLDIACFFVGGDKDTTITILEGCNYFALVGIQNLIDRNMLAIVGNNLVMHQLIQEMGWEIVRQESPKELGERSRLWNHKDSFSVLKGKTGTTKIRGLVLDMHFLKEDEFEWNSFGPNSCSKKRKRFPFSIFSGFPMGITTKNSNVALEGCAFSHMPNLQLLQISHVQLFGNYENFPRGLRWLHWSHFPLQTIPNDLPLDKLVALEMPYSCLKKVLNGAKCLILLKILNLSHSHDLFETPDFSRLLNLERLILENCTRLVKVDKSIGCLERLVFLNLSNCQSLRELPQTICRLKSLATLDLSGCNLGNFLAEQGNMNSLAMLLADGTATNRLFSITGEVKVWQLSAWPRLLNPRSQPKFSWVSFPQSLVHLSLANCNLSDDSFPRDFSNLSSLGMLNLSQNPICSLPNCIRDLFGLKKLWLESCPRLLTLHGLHQSLEELWTRNSELLEKISFDSIDLSGKTLGYYPCRRLVEIFGSFKLEPLESVDAELINNLGLCEFEGMEKSYIHFLSMYGSCTWRISPPLGFHERYTFCTYVLGSKMPSKFSLKNVGSSISFTMPSDANFKTQGLSVCSVYALPGTCNASSGYVGLGSLPPFHTIISNATKHLKWSYCPEVHGFPSAGEDMMWLSYWKFEDQLEGGDEVNISVTGNFYQVKEIGVHLMYKEAEEKKSTQSLSLEVAQQIHPYENVLPSVCNGDCEDCKNFPVPADPASTRVFLLGTHLPDCEGCPLGYLEYHHGMLHQFREGLGAWVKNV